MGSGASIIIVTYNSTSTISECITSVSNWSRPEDEIIIVDNNSQDNTLEVVQKLASLTEKKLRILPQSKNHGFAKGCNIGIESSNEEYIILLNPDTQVFGDWVAKLTAHFNYYRNTGAVGPISNYTIPNQHIQTYLPNYEDYIQNASQLINILEQKFNKRSIPSKLLIGFCMALRRDLIELYGGLDEDFFLGIEDLEISWRLREKGYLLRVALDVFVNHFGHISFNTMPKAQTDQFVQKGADILYEKMRSYYYPDKVPHPLDFFGIGWWQPTILQQKFTKEVFAPQLQKRDYNNLLKNVKNLLKDHFYLDALQHLEKSLRIFVNDYTLWYTLGSIYLILADHENAEYALKNAWSLEGESTRARTKLMDLLIHQGRLDEVNELFGEV